MIRPPVRASDWSSSLFRFVEEFCDETPDEPEELEEQSEQKKKTEPDLLFVVPSPSLLLFDHLLDLLVETNLSSSLRSNARELLRYDSIYP